MISRWCAPCLTLSLAVLVASHAQTLTSQTQSPTKGDYSQEAAVIEEMASKVAFDNDGNSTREQTTRVRVQTDAGVKEWGLLKFPFQSSTQTVEIDYVRVHKADGSTLSTVPDNAQDLDSEITRSAPFYSDLREKHIAVKGLGPGDILEYQAHWRSTKPLIPGQFWLQFNFQSDGIVLDERLEIKVPSGRAVKVKGPPATQTMTTEGESRIYSWTYSKLQSAKDPGSDEKKLTEAARGLLPVPDVQISSFQSWEEVGRWYWDLQKDRIEPTPAIRSKAAELTKGMTDDAAKLRALYSFVSTQYRYIGIAFGIGRYQPHAADDVLTNSYGDCKDKHTLLASLLQASGITLYPALINSSWKLDPEVPSPAQFDHIIGYLPQSDKNKDAIWLDTTIEVAPFGYLVPRLRDKPALVMAGDKSIQLVTTRADSPFPNSEAFKIDGKVNTDGSLEAKIEDTSRGDSEVLLRTAFRQVAQPQWKDLVQRISYAMGFAGTVSEISASKPEAIGEPFHIAYSYNRKDYPDWKSNQRFTVPGSPFFMPSVADDAKYPLWLGASLEGVSDSRVELPPGYEPQTPLNVDLKYDFAEYHASYSHEHGVLIAKRRLVTKLREVPVAEFDDYRKFVKDVQDDVNQYVPTSSAGEPAASNMQVTAGAPVSLSPSMRALRELPASTSPEAYRLEAEARDEMAKRDLHGAVSSLYRAVAVDPKFTRAWVMLGELLLGQKQVDAGIDAFHKAMAADPEQPAIPKALGWTLMARANYDEAIPVWQDYMKAHPDDDDGPANLGRCFTELKRYPDAVKAYDASLKVSKNPAGAQARLGSAYLQAGDRDKANAAFIKLAEIDSKGSTFNDVAYEMTNADLNLPLALDYAKKAVRYVEEESQKTDLPDLKIEDLRRVQAVAAYWDTLGWVENRMSNLEESEQYLLAAWRVSQDGVVASHLCQVYERVHKIESAEQMCRLAVYRISASAQSASSELKTELDGAQKRLDHLTGGGGGKSKSMVETSEIVTRERMFKLPRFLTGTESAEFFVLLESDGKSKTFKVKDVKFVSGSEKMKLQGKQLASIDFKVPAPSETPTRFVRRGILGCYQYSGCFFVLLDPATVQSLN
jgi:tetratricopeptide (TPR) repeat protein/transglutaminase-like putative cysteine protease